MVSFQNPEFEDFYDDRIIVSWKISQPSTLPSLKNLTFKIIGLPNIEFDPLQEPSIEIPELNSNDFILNWIIRKPSCNTKIILSVQNELVSEEYHLNINFEN